MCRALRAHPRAGPAAEALEIASDQVHRYLQRIDNREVRMSKVMIGLAVLMGTIACGNIFGAEDEPEIPRLAVSVVPDAIAASDSFDVVVSVINPSHRPQSVVSGCQGGALYQLGVQGPHAVRLEPVTACVMQSREVEIPADGLEGLWRVRLYPLDRATVQPGIFTIHAAALAWPLDDSEAVATLIVE